MKIRFALVALAVLTMAGILAACGGGADQPEPTATSRGDAAAGEVAFQTTCVSCHGPDAKGIEGLGKDLTTSEWTQQQTDEQLVEFLKVGRPASDPLNTTGVDMPPKGGNPALTDDDLWNIVAHLRSIHQ